MRTVPGLIEAQVVLGRNATSIYQDLVEAQGFGHAYNSVDEMAHLLVPGHKADFLGLMDKHWPRWRESRAELNALPLRAETWRE
jgi:hypothetical protein